MPGTVLLLAASPAGRGCLVDAASVLPVLAAVAPPVLSGTDTANVVELADPLEPQAVLTRLRAAAAVPGPLTLFLAGQLQLDRREHLPHLALARTTPATVRYTAFPWHWIGEELRLRPPGTTTVFADLHADAESWRLLRARPLDCGRSVLLYGRVAPPPPRRALGAPAYMKAVATILRSGHRPDPATLHHEALTRTLGETGTAPGPEADIILAPVPNYAAPPGLWPTPPPGHTPHPDPQPHSGSGPTAPPPYPEHPAAVRAIPAPPQTEHPSAVGELPAPPYPEPPTAVREIPAPPHPPAVVFAAPAPPPPAPEPSPRPRPEPSPNSNPEPAPGASPSPAPAPAPTPTPLPDPHAALAVAVQEGRHTEAAALALWWERVAQREHGAGSEEVLHWMEVRADLAMLAGDPGVSCAAWLAVAAARLAAGQPPGDPAVEAAVDRAHHQWGRMTDTARACELGPELVELRERVPGRREGALHHVREHLRRLETGLQPQP
ncbi:hypothetical protein ACIQ6V_06885 [Streptomyces sp. NPDC096198]|uniref:hypothetical protein n=1 Tax=Streptomyces sp. NPDC096198 TaxID=3366080 RepID=UPI003825E8E5